MLPSDDNDNDVVAIVISVTYLHTIMQKFIACAQSPLGNECLDFNDATIFSYFRGSVQCPSFDGGGVGLLVENNAFPSSVNANVRATDVRYNAVFPTAAGCRLSSSGSNEFRSFQSKLLLRIDSFNVDDAFVNEPCLLMDRV